MTNFYFTLGKLKNKEDGCVVCKKNEDLGLFLVDTQNVISLRSSNFM